MRDRGPLLADQSATAVLLFPAALLILLTLGLTAIESAAAFMAQRQLSELSEAIANEVVAAVDVDRFLGGDGELALDPARARDRIGVLMDQAAADPVFGEVACVDPVVDGLEVTVTCAARVETGLAPGWSPRRELSATTTVEGIVG